MLIRLIFNSLYYIQVKCTGREGKEVLGVGRQDSQETHVKGARTGFNNPSLLEIVYIASLPVNVATALLARRSLRRFLQILCLSPDSTKPGLSCDFGEISVTFP
jgi:hypothetical protein